MGLGLGLGGEDELVVPAIVSIPKVSGAMVDGAVVSGAMVSRAMVIVSRAIVRTRCGHTKWSHSKWSHSKKSRALRHLHPLALLLAEHAQVGEAARHLVKG